MTTFLE